MNTTMAGNMRQNGAGGVNVVPGAPMVACPVCHTLRPRNRKWTKYCSDRCRKAAYLIRQSEQTPADVRATLNRIETRLDRIEVYFGLKGGPKT